ncbi:MAG TPA: SAF domain-containing protein [Streptosporangiales bacterium]
MSNIGTTRPTRPAGAAEPAVSPPASRVRGPRWKDPRLVVGILLVLVSVAVGARVFTTADRTTAVWAAARDLDVGTVLTGGDVVQKRVRLLDTASRYVAGGQSPVGYVLTRAVGSGELLPTAAIQAPGRAHDHRLVTVAVDRDRLPPGLAGGARVDVYVTPKSTGGAADSPAVLVVPAANVATAPQTGGQLGAATAQVPVVLSVPPDLVADLIDSSRHGDVDLVTVPAGSKVTATPESTP